MSKYSIAIIPLILIVLLSAFFYFSPNFLPQSGGGGDAVKNTMTKRFANIGNLIAHATFVEDALIMEETANLNEIIVRFQQDEEEIEYIHFTDADNTVLASSDNNMIGESFTPAIMPGDETGVRERNGVYEAAFTISVGTTVIGKLFFSARPVVQTAAGSSSPSPIVLGVGIIVGFIAFFIIIASFRGLEAGIVEDINKRQEEIYSPKIESLKMEQDRAQKEVANLNKQLSTAKQNLQKLNDEYGARKKEIESSPVMKSIEKLKESETDILKKLEKLKEEEQRLNKEITLISQKREEVRSALEAEKKEERTLHEKLDLIKRKILHLETPKK
jgi:hypothetical protein